MQIEYHSHKNKIASLLELIKSHNLSDVWRDKNPHKSQYTWKRKNSLEKSRIYFWLVDSNLLAQVYSSDIRPACINSTDHMAISLKLKSQNNRGPGYWKLNHSYLDDEQYFDLICQTIDSCNDLTIESAQIKWEVCKIEIKSKTIEFAKLKSRERHNKLSQLEKKLQHLHYLPNDSINHNEINDLETEIMQQYEFKSKGAQIRSRIQFLEEGEFFFH